MYEWIKKTFSNIKSIIFCGVLLILLLLSIISTVGFVATTKHLRRVEQRLDDVRTELSNAQDRERELTETVDNIESITARTDKILSESGNTVQGIREKIQVLQEYFDRVNLYINTSSSNDYNIDNKE